MAIEHLADEAVEMEAAFVGAVADVTGYRAVLREAVHRLAAVERGHEQLRASHGRLLDEFRGIRAERDRLKLALERSQAWAAKLIAVGRQRRAERDEARRARDEAHAAVRDMRGSAA
jgi:hypothetical protein